MEPGDGGTTGGRARPAPRPAPATQPDADRRATAAPSLAEAEALADPTRYRLHRLLVEADAPLSVAQLTRAVGVHHTAVRQHLVRLREVGLVAEEQAAPAGRGRPPMLYRGVPAAGDGDADAYRRLALLLARAVRTGEAPREVGRRAGEQAAELALAASPGADAVAVLVDQAGRMGFRPELSEGGVEVVLRNCPFRDVAAHDPATVCSLHLGLAEGIAGWLGGMEVTGLVVEDPDHAGCRITLRPQRHGGSEDDDGDDGDAAGSSR